MDPRAAKMATRGIDPDLAERLVRAGLDRPSRVRRASDRDIEDIPGIGKAARQAIREVVGKDR